MSLPVSRQATDPKVFWPRAYWFRNRATARPLKIHAKVVRDKNAMTCQQTWRPNFGTVARVSFQFQNSYRMNTRRCPSVFNTKEKSTRFAGASINFSGRHANYSHEAKQSSLLPHAFSAFGVVCGGNSNENENFAKSGISQDVCNPPSSNSRGCPTNSRCKNNETTKEYWPHERGVQIFKTLRLQVLKGNLSLEAPRMKTSLVPNIRQEV